MQVDANGTVHLQVEETGDIATAIPGTEFKGLGFYLISSDPEKQKATIRYHGCKHSGF